VEKSEVYLHKMNKLVIVIGLIILSAISVMADDGYDGPEITADDKAYFKQLQHAVLTDDEKWMSKELCGYPFTVNMPTGEVNIKNKEGLKKRLREYLTLK
jgi:hypothetical protein